jgi:drug/metabolite transporter (DMT)-like permease
MPMSTSRAGTSATLLAFTAIYIIWGTTFLCITLMLRTVPAFLGGAVRFLAAGGAMYVWLRAREPRPFAGLHVGGTALCGVLLTGMGNGFVIWSQIALPSGIEALFIGALPVSVLLLDWLFFSRRAPRPLAALGVALGLAGIVVLSLNTQAIAHNARPIYVIAALVAEFAWALGTLLQPRYVGPARVINFTCLQMLFGAAFQLLMALLDREWLGFVPSHISLQSWLALAYLIIFGSIIAFSCYSFLVAHVSAQKVSTYALVNPVIALALGAAVLGERITPAAIVSTVLVLAGVGLVLLQRSPVGSQAPPTELAAVGRAEP